VAVTLINWLCFLLSLFIEGENEVRCMPVLLVVRRYIILPLTVVFSDD
jgi:hypothetical protein